MHHLIAIIGRSGYVGSVVAHQICQRGWGMIDLSRSRTGKLTYRNIRDHLDIAKPTFVINCAGFTGVHNVDSCNIDRCETIEGNIVLPVTIQNACDSLRIPHGTVGSGCIYSGAYLIHAATNTAKLVIDMNDPNYRPIFDRCIPSLRNDDEPWRVVGFSEMDRPNFTFRTRITNPSSFYSGTKALAEEHFDGAGYLWRLRIPFSHVDHPKNYLSKMQVYDRLLSAVNSMSNIHDFANACLDMIEKRVPFGIYNVVNPGYITTERVVQLLKESICKHKKFKFWSCDSEFYAKAAKEPRSNCVLSTAKMESFGIALPTVEESIRRCLASWLVNQSPSADRNRSVSNR